MSKSTITFLMMTLSSVSSSIFRIPSQFEMNSFLQATPLFPSFRAPLIPGAGIENARVDYGVGLPGGRLQPYEGCSQNKTLQVWDFGTIESPKYPEDYPASTTCEWNLISPEGTKIEATIYDINIQPWFLNYYDALSLSKDGSFYMNDNYAGDQNSKTPFSVNATANRFGIRFKSDALINDRGFKLQYVVRPVDEAAAEYSSPYDGVCGNSFVVNNATTTSPVEGTTSAPVESTTGGSRIIGTTPAPKHGYPWMVALLIDGKSFCGGSVIDETHILTAGHCTKGAEQITVLLGAHDIKASKEEEPERRVVNITKENIFTHPKYNEDNVFNDISILRLPEKLTFDENIRPICLPTRRYLAETFDKEKVGVSGWGITADMGKISPVLQETEVEVLANGNCRQVFREILTGNNICIKTTPKNSPCRGDSGGPLFLRQNGAGGESYVMQIGIVSFGTFTCERGFPVAFTRTSAFLDYINLITGKSL